MTSTRPLLLEARGDIQALTVLETAWVSPLLKVPPQLVRIGPDLVRLAVAGRRPELGQAVVEAMNKATARSPVASWRAALSNQAALRAGSAGSSTVPVSATIRKS
jgi:hypothetical protein